MKTKISAARGRPANDTVFPWQQPSRPCLSTDSSEALIRALERSKGLRDSRVCFGRRLFEYMKRIMGIGAADSTSRAGFESPPFAGGVGGRARALTGERYLPDSLRKLWCGLASALAPCRVQSPLLSELNERRCPAATTYAC